MRTSIRALEGRFGRGNRGKHQAQATMQTIVAMVVMSTIQVLAPRLTTGR